MELIEVILSKENLNRAYKKVVANKGASGVDGVTVEELGDYIRKNREKIVTSLRNRTYIPKPVRRVYIPKDNGKKRPLGIPTALDRTIQQAIAQPISDIYEEIFSDYSYGFRAGRSCHDAIRQALEYLNDGYEWVVDIDIEQFFDKVNHDKLIQILREQVNDSTTLNLIRKYLKAGVMENGLEKATITGVPQGGPLSVVCSNVYLDKLDKELEHRGLRFTRYADDVLIFTKSEMAANRVMNSISDWLERKLFLKVNATKTKVVRPMSRICERIRSSPPICRRCKTSKTLPACMVPRIDTPHRAQSATAAKSSGSPSSSTAMICGDMERSSIWIPCSFGQLSSTSVRGPRSFCGIPR